KIGQSLEMREPGIGDLVCGEGQALETRQSGQERQVSIREAGRSQIDGNDRMTWVVRIALDFSAPLADRGDDSVLRDIVALCQAFRCRESGTQNGSECGQSNEQWVVSHRFTSVGSVRTFAMGHPYGAWVRSTLSDCPARLSWSQGNMPHGLLRGCYTSTVFP